MKYIFFLIVIFFSFKFIGQTYLAPTTGINGSYAGGCPIGTNTGTYYDNGGAASNYSTSINGIYQTICPTTAGQSISLTFTSFNMENTFDYIRIGNGPAQGSTIFVTAPATALGRITGTPAVPFTYTATNSSGCLTVHLYSDIITTAAGFAATISTVNNGSALAVGNSDCSTSTYLCSNASINDVSYGPGIVPDEGCTSSCLTGETYSNWYTFSALTSGTLTLTINPNTNSDDYDFAVFGPNVSCGAATAPIRCSFASAAGNGNTGLTAAAVDLSEGSSGDGDVAQLNVIAGETYQLYVNSWSPSSAGFALSFGGTATIGAIPPTINSPTACANSPTVLTATPPKTGGTYLWSPGGETTQSITVSPAVTTTYSCTYTIDGCTSAAGTGTVTVTPVVVPSVSITSSDADNTICAGTSVTFTATPTNGGAAPTYQWQLNGANVGTGGTTYTTTSLVNGDVVTCILTSNATCPSPATATSSGITTTVNPVLVPSVSITSSDADNTICAGTSVTFTATPTNGGAAPTYQWQLNGANVGTGGTTYTTSGLVNGDVVTCILTSNALCASPTTATSSGITTTVNPVLVPSVSITSSDADNTICAGTSVTFTATPTNGGATPTYQWQLNGANVGTGGTTYTTTSLVNGDVVTCILTSNYACASPTTATSSGITTTVNPVLVPSVSITSSDADNTICAGTSVTFTATPTNGGAAPTYQWQLNGANVGTGGTTYTTTSLANGDVVTCILTSNALCASPSTATSAGITTTVNPVLVPSVSIASSDADNTICTGTSVTFTATPTNGGAVPTYQWQLNGVNVGTGGTTYTTTGLVNGDVVTCILTSNATCASPSTATSSGITTTVTTVLVPSVSITSSDADNTICTGTSVTFTATPTNGGAAPTYQWQLNGVNVGTGGTTYTTTGLVNGDVVTCILTSNDPCASPTTATSSGITTTVTAVLVPSVSIASSDADNTICTGTSVTFTATPTNGGTTPTYQWQLNGVNVGTGGTTYTTSGLVNGDVVTCILTSNDPCASPTTATSSGITTTVTAVLVPSVSITSSDADNTICVGTSVTFTATPTNGGTTPTYQWQLNGVNVGTGGTTYTTSGLVNGDVVTCILTSNDPCASPTNATSPGITTTVVLVMVPSVSITSSDADNTICAGTSVTFTATPTNGGAAPTYQWQLNGVNVGTGGTTYTTTSLVNGDVVTCILTSNDPCALPTTATSSGITTTVNPVLIPSVSITSNDADNTICAGTSVTFTATPTNGGAAPTYQWKLNGSNVGTGGTTYTTSGLINGDVITCILTSNATCASPSTATSSGITTTVNPVLVPSISITSSDADNTICAGTSVTFTATPTNGGAAPTYQWQLNGANVGTGGTTYTTTGLVNGDIVTCILTSNATCVSPSTATSSGITTTVTPVLVPSISISSSDSDNTICAGTSVTFTATPTNGGTSPTYQWQLNGVNVSTGGTTYTTSSLVNGDVVTCILTSNAVCVSPSTATSSSISTTVPSPPTAPVIGTITQPTCANATGSVNLSGLPATGTWTVTSSPGALTLINSGTTGAFTGLSPSTTYTFTVTNDLGCTSSQSGNVVINPTPIVPAITSTTTMSGCTIAGTIQLNNSDIPAAITPWSSSDVSVATISSTGLVDGITTGTSTITFTNNLGCTVTQVITINPNPTIAGTLTVCEGYTAQFTGSELPDATNPWITSLPWFATVSNTGEVTGVSAGSCNLIYMNNFGCFTVSILTVNTTPTMPIISSDTTYCSILTPSLLVSDTSFGGYLTWYSDITLKDSIGTGLTLTPSMSVGTNTYYVTETLNGCESPANVSIQIINFCDIDIPTAFTPDGNLVNDTWELAYIDKTYPKNQITIYNRWGNLVYESAEGTYNSKPWNGTMNGQELPVESYYYIIKYNDGSTIDTKGTVTIVRK